MKKLLGITAAFMIMFSSVANAGHSENTRKHCHWWAKRYTATGHIATVKCGIHYSLGHNGDCSYAWVDFTRDWCCGTSAHVHSESNGAGHYGYFNNAGCSKYSGGALSDLLMELMPDGGGTTADETYPASNTVTSNPQFNDGMVLVSHISVVLSSNINDPAPNTYTLALWKPQDDSVNGWEDSVYTQDKAIMYGTVTLTSGVLTVTGTVFTPDNFVMTQEAGQVTVTYVGGDKVLPLPAAIDPETLAVIDIGDIGDDQHTMLKHAITTQNTAAKGTLDYSIYPNPAKESVTLQINSSEATTIKVSIYDAVGNLVAIKENIQVNAGETTTQINTSTLPSGQYFILAQGAGVKVIKELTKQ